MSADWQVGDLALRCAPTNLAPMFPPPFGHSMPKQGGVYEVEGLARDGGGFLGLILVGHHSGHPRAPAWRASSFVKITPEQADAFDREVIEAMRPTPAPACRTNTLEKRV
jgi:hypothetical protein